MNSQAWRWESDVRSCGVIRRLKNGGEKRLRPAECAAGEEAQQRLQGSKGHALITITSWNFLLKAKNG